MTKKELNKINKKIDRDASYTIYAIVRDGLLVSKRTRAVVTSHNTTKDILRKHGVYIAMYPGETQPSYRATGSLLIEINNANAGV